MPGFCTGNYLGEGRRRETDPTPPGHIFQLCSWQMFLITQMAFHSIQSAFKKCCTNSEENNFPRKWDRMKTRKWTVSTSSLSPLTKQYDPFIYLVPIPSVLTEISAIWQTTTISIFLPNPEVVIDHFCNNTCFCVCWLLAHLNHFLPKW